MATRRKSTHRKPNTIALGRAIVERDGSGYLCMMPDGEIVQAAKRSVIDAALKRYAKQNTPQDAVSALTVEWRENLVTGA